VGLTLLTLMSTPRVASLLIAPLEHHEAVAPREARATGADGILVLGAGRYSWAPEYGGDTVGGATLQRVRYGAFLYRQTGLPVYVTGGNPPPDEPPLGQLMAEVLATDYGIAVAGIEDRSLTTEENALFSAPMLREDGIRRVLLVTNAAHMPRSVGAFERVGIEVTPAPTYFVHKEGERRETSYRDWLPSAGAFLVSYFAVHEWIGRVWYRIKAQAP
jgi:uncharacterized SAM-binding protein YcdF (DUF218 family)